MTELVARFKGITVFDAVALLTSKQLIKRRVKNYEKKLNDYITKTVEFRYKLLNFWEICKQNNQDMSPEYTNIARVLELNIGNHWCEVGSQLIGFCHKSDAEKALIVKERSQSSLNSGCNRPFMGEGWGHICVIPAFDMPGRIKTFTFIGISEVDGSLLQTNRHIAYRTWGPREVECGMVFLEQALRMPDKKIIMASDAVDTVKMALDYVEKSGKIPPIIVQANEPERISLSWKLFKEDQKTIVAVGSKAMSMALSDTSLHTSICPGAWTQPWIGSQKWVSKVIEDSCPQKDVVETSPQDLFEYRHVMYGGKKYEERPDGMYCNDNIECDAVLVIEKILVENKSHYYQGYINCGPGKVTFKSSTYLMDYSYSRWLKELCLSNNLDMPRCSREFAKVAVKIATIMSKPTIEVVTPDSDVTDVFRFGNYNIRSTGEIVKTGYTHGMKSSGLMVNDSLNEFEKGALGDENSATAWAVISCALANPLAYALGHRTIGIGVDPETFPDAKRVGELLGCVVNKMDGMTFAKSIMATTLAMEARMQLPMIADPEKVNAPIQRLNLQKASGSRNCMVGMDRLAVLGARTIGRWAYINQHPICLEEVLESALQKFTLNFLSWVIKNKHEITGRGLFNKTVDALRKWCAAQGISQDGLNAGLGLVDCDCSSSTNIYVASAFVELCKTFLMMNEIEVCKREGMRVKFKNEAWLPCREVFRACKHHNVPISEPGKLTSALLATKAIIQCSSNPDNRLISWVILEEMWQEWSAGV